MLPLRKNRRTGKTFSQAFPWEDATGAAGDSWDPPVAPRGASDLLADARGVSYWSPETGSGGKQIQLEDLDDNPVEFFEPAG